MDTPAWWKLETRPNEGSSKVLPLSEAIKAIVRPGMLLHIGSMPARPMAALWELIRQYRGTNPDFAIAASAFISVFGGSALVHSGIVRKVISSFVGGHYPGPAPSRVYNTAFREGKVEFEHWTMLTMSMRLKAAAMGLPFAVTKSMIGSSMAHERADALRMIDNPFEPSERVALAEALQPDLSIIHGLAADEHGNTLFAPPWVDNTWGAMAAREGAIVTVERIVSTDEIRRHSHFGRLPGNYVRSVSEVPFGAHPTGVNNQNISGWDGYAEDYDFLLEARQADREARDMDDWLEKWVYSLGDHQEYLDKVGFQRLLFLRGKAQGDSYQQELESAKQRISAAPEHTATEHMVAVSARMTAEILKRKGYHTILAGLGASSLASWIAAAFLREEGVDVDLMAEIGLFGYTPRPADPFIFNHRNIPTAKGLADIEQVLGIFATGGHNSCLGSLGAGQVDKHGNINSTFLPPDRLIVGSGGGNDVASGSAEVLVTTAQSRSRFVEAVPYVTSPGGRVSTLVSTLGVYEKPGEGDELILTGYLVRKDETEEEAVRQIREQCGWELKVAPKLRRHGPPSVVELSLMRMFDPSRCFLED